MLACHLVQRAMFCSYASQRCRCCLLEARHQSLPPPLCLDAHCRLRQDAFHSEVAIRKACRNKNIVAYIADYVDDERTWLIMEYMEV